MISWSSSTASSTPATSLKPIFGESGAIRFARDSAEAHHLRAAALTWFIRKIQKAIRMMNGSSEKNALTHEKPPVPLESNVVPLLSKVSMICGIAWSAG